MPTVSQVLSISDSQEPNPWLVKNGFLYFGQNYGGNPDYKGYIKKLNLSTNEVTNLTPNGLDMWAMWQAVYDIKNNRIIAVGEVNDENGVLRAGVTIIDLSNDAVNKITHPNTGDCNEFIGVALDYKNNRLIVGERVYGGNTNGSSYPNGGGLWTIPLNTITDPSTWSRVYEDPDYAVWSTIAIFKDKVYAGIFRNGVKAVIACAPLSDLTSWTVLEQSSRNDRHAMVDADDKMVAYTFVNADGKVVVKYSTDGETWNQVTVCSAPSGAGADQLRIIGKYIVVFVHDGSAKTQDIYLIDTSTNEVYLVQSMSGAITGHGRGAYDGEQKHYFGCQTPSTPSYIYSLAFDAKNTLVLSLSNSNPAPSEVITLTATLTDENGNPVSGAEIEFYVIHFRQNGHCAVGDLIGTATTGSDGKASIQYTIPSDASGKLIFRAIYKG